MLMHFCQKKDINEDAFFWQKGIDFFIDPAHLSHPYHLVIIFPAHLTSAKKSFAAQMTRQEMVCLIWKNSRAWLLRCRTCVFELCVKNIYMNVKMST